MDTYPHQYEPLFTMSTDYYTPLIGDNMMLFNQQQEKLAEPQQYPQQQQQQQQQQLKEEQNDTQAHDSSKKKAKRKQVKNACVNCQKACKKCDNGRPCQRCIKLGLTATCVDSPRKERRKGIKRGPYKKRQTSQSPSSTSTTQTSGMPPRLTVHTAPNPWDNTFDWQPTCYSQASSLIEGHSFHQMALQEQFSHPQRTTTPVVATQPCYYPASPESLSSSSPSSYSSSPSPCSSSSQYSPYSTVAASQQIFPESPLSTPPPMSNTALSNNLLNSCSSNISSNTSPSAAPSQSYYLFHQNMMLAKQQQIVWSGTPNHLASMQPF